MYRQLTSVFLLAAALVRTTHAATSVATDAPTPTISAIRPMPPGYSASARELSPLETGWSWTQRIVGTTSRVRTTIGSTLGIGAPPKGLPPVLWAKRIELLTEGQPPKMGAEVAVKYDKSGAVVAIGELVDGASKRKLNRWYPARMLIPAVVKAARS